MYLRWTITRVKINVEFCVVVGVLLSMIMDAYGITEESTRRPTSRQAIPKFVPTPINVTVHRGDLAELHCHIKNLGPKMVVWRKASEENPLTLGEVVFTPASEISIHHEQISQSDSRWNLLIKNVQPEHAGVYECQISATGIYTHYVALNVLNYPAKRKPQVTIYGTEYVNEYSNIQLTCNASGVDRAPDDIDWFFDGTKLTTSHPHWYGRLEITKHRPLPGLSYISEITIQHSTLGDSGNYVCRSSDIEVDSLTVHVLNVNKDGSIVPRAPGEESDSIRSAESGAHSAAFNHKEPQVLLLFLILTVTACV
ncbi:peroxidasin homolog [Dreissena polymorpha]|uniref:peroxidasin homolog n=1 Tax=Dreissena polymorpha TaxID=45954 RepID=UPI0022655CEF|nr:peroxidasin homolog [Dreissena polymorpha]